MTTQRPTPVIYFNPKPGSHFRQAVLARGAQPEEARAQPAEDEHQQRHHAIPAGYAATQRVRTGCATMRA